MSQIHPRSLPEDLQAYKKQIKRLFGGIFAPGRKIFIARVPGRLDVMGGIADYSGSTVLELPLQPATIVGVQQRRDRRILVRSLSEANKFSEIFEYHLDDFYQDGKLKPFETLRNEFAAQPQHRWAAYVVGAFAVLLSEGLVDEFENGANIGIKSNIPFGVGISSSAALEVATMFALQHAFSIKLEKFQIARASQIVENQIVGAPCGIMDQVTCVMGEKGKLLALRCQPHELLKMIPVPKGYQFVGINSGVKHTVNGTRYVNARVSTFMGRKIIFSQVPASDNDLPYGGYLCNVTPEEWDSTFRKIVPSRLRGQEFIEKYHSHDDPATQIEPEKYYKPKSRTEHAIMENSRVHEFIELLESANEKADEMKIIHAGELMYQSHESYSKNCGLGAKETDLLVDLVKVRGPENGFYGAKITGGGSGGTVAILAAQGTNDIIQNIAAQYYDETKIEPDIFFGSSPGAFQLGVVQTIFE